MRKILGYLPAAGFTVYYLYAGLLTGAGMQFPMVLLWLACFWASAFLLHKGLFWGGVFADEVPDGDWFDAAMEFYLSENATPKKRSGQTAKAIDMVLDGDYITASFQQAYGIDLTQGDMHWHRFKALLNGLPESTVLSRIMGYRTFERKKVDREAEMMRLREEWALPDEVSERQRQEALDAFERWAG